MNCTKRIIVVTAAVAALVVLGSILFPENVSHESPCYPNLVDSVKAFALFVGYPRSGHSIIGALMDAHPHIIMAHEYFLFSKFDQLNLLPSKLPDRLWKSNLFDALYGKSVADAHGVRMISKKGYTLSVEDLWQGMYKSYVGIIGDKSGGNATKEYLRDSEEFKRNYAQLKQKLGIPIRIIHAVRNPFDIISTAVAIKTVNTTQYAKLKKMASPEQISISDDVMKVYVSEFFRMVEAVTEMIEEVFGRKNVFEVHNCDLVSNPKGTLMKIFEFLEIGASDSFLDQCAAKVFSSVSRSRDRIVWSLELREMMNIKMKDYRMFDRYNFTSM